MKVKSKYKLGNMIFMILEKIDPFERMRISFIAKLFNLLTGRNSH